MGMARGESDIYFGTDVGNWGAKGNRNFFRPAERGKMFFPPPCVYTQNAQIFVETSNMGAKHKRNFHPLTQPPSPALADGPSMCHLSPVSRGGGGISRGRTTMNIPGVQWHAPLCMRRFLRCSTGGGGSGAVNFVWENIPFQTGRELSQTKSRGFCEIGTCG